MKIIPAIDLKEGKCVRLREGKMDQETIFSEDPNCYRQNIGFLKAQIYYI